MKYLIANWKAQLSLPEVENWIETFRQQYKKNKNVTIILCPPFPFLLYVKEKTLGLPNVHVGSQNISHFDHGKHTGEVTARSLSEIVTYSILGHSERRSGNEETEEQIETKIDLCDTYHISPILCVRDEKDTIYDNVEFIAYEPVSAIGTGQNEDPAKVLEMKKRFKLPPGSIFIYGGSVNKDNYQEYYEKAGVDGFLVGGASLDPKEFLALAS